MTSSFTATVHGAIAAAALTLLPSTGRAQCTLLYDFESSTPVPNETLWLRSNKSGPAPSIVAASACDNSTGYTGNGAAQSPLPYAFRYPVGSHAVWSFECRARAASVGLAFDQDGPIGTDRFPAFGCTIVGEVPRTQLIGFPVPEGQSEWRGDQLQAGGCYEFRLLIDFGVQGGSATMQYRPVGSAASFTTDGTIVNRPLRIPAGRAAYWVHATLSNSTVDDLRFDNPCRADFDCSMSISVQDLFTYLAAYFGNDLSADMNASGGISVQDLFDFLAIYFAGCV